MSTSPKISSPDRQGLNRILSIIALVLIIVGASYVSYRALRSLRIANAPDPEINYSMGTWGDLTNPTDEQSAPTTTPRVTVPTAPRPIPQPKIVVKQKSKPIAKQPSQQIQPATPIGNKTDADTALALAQAAVANARIQIASFTQAAGTDAAIEPQLRFNAAVEEIAFGIKKSASLNYTAAQVAFETAARLAYDAQRMSVIRN